MNLPSEAVKIDVELRVVLKRLLDLKTEIEKKLEELESQAKPLEEQELHDALEKINDLIGKIRFNSLDKAGVL